jgi:predicted nucleic acid-binding protein
VRIGVDTSVIVAAVHANHPVNGPAAEWLDAAFGKHEVVVAHHSIVESYAVLTRLPAKYRLAPREAEMVLTETLRENVRIAPFAGEAVWPTLESIIDRGASGGTTYDALIVDLLAGAGVEVIITYNVREFRRIARDTPVEEPSFA